MEKVYLFAVTMCAMLVSFYLAGHAVGELVYHLQHGNDYVTALLRSTAGLVICASLAWIVCRQLVSLSQQG